VFAQHCAEFQVRSTPDTLRAIGNPKMYKPTQQFSPARPGPATRRIVEGQIIDAARSFCIPAAVDGHRSPWRLFGDRVTHNLALFISFKMIAGQTGHGHGPDERRHGTRRKRRSGVQSTYFRTASSRSSARILYLDPCQ
jgi:hypothetical protein